MIENRTKLAYLIAPIFPALYMLAMPYFSGSHYSGLHDTLMVLLFSLPISYLSCFFLGFPFVRFLKNRKYLSLVNVVAGGAVLGMFVYYIFGYGFSAFLDSSMSSVSHVSVLMWGAVLGVLVALPFSIIAGFPIIYSNRVDN